MSAAGESRAIDKPVFQPARYRSVLAKKTLPSPILASGWAGLPGARIAAPQGHPNLTACRSGR